MNRPRILLALVLAAAASEAGLAFPLFGTIKDQGDTATAVYSSTNADYHRAVLADGTTAPELYGLAVGGYFGSGYHDETIDRETFASVAHALEGPLAERQFLPTWDPKKASLLIVVYWGATNGTLDSSSLNFQYARVDRPKAIHDPAPLEGPVSYQGDLEDLRNAIILGYADELARTPPNPALIHNAKRDDLIEDIEHNRYFVALFAYDFQDLLKNKHRKLLWEARFSMRERGNDFARMLPAMAKYASQFFGEDSHGLMRTELPAGNVEVGVPQPVPDAAGRDPLGHPPLVAGSEAFPAQSSRPAPTPLPAALRARIDTYESRKSTLEAALAEAMRAPQASPEAKRAIDLFRSENAGQIEALSRDADAIRTELARLAAKQPSADQTVDSLVQQFSEEHGVNPLFTHP